MFIAYNLRRIGNILTREVLKEYLRMLFSLFLVISDLQGVIFLNSGGLVLAETIQATKNRLWLKRA